MKEMDDEDMNFEERFEKNLGSEEKIVIPEIIEFDEKGKKYIISDSKILISLFETKEVPTIDYLLDYRSEMVKNILKKNVLSPKEFYIREIIAADYILRSTYCEGEERINLEKKIPLRKS